MTAVDARALRAPAAVALTGAGATLLLHFHDPHRAYSYGVCPFHAVTGLWCPGCGGLRAVNDLTNGDIAGAFASNILVPPLIVVLVGAWLLWVRRRWRGGGGRMIALDRNVGYVALALIVAFTVARNTPWGAWLAPT